jgi:hypothetical protein
MQEYNKTYAKKRIWLCSRTFLIYDVWPGCNKSGTTGATCRAGSDFSSGAPEFIPGS